jgi:hypothetical protein
MNPTFRVLEVDDKRDSMLYFPGGLWTRLSDARFEYRSCLSGMSSRYRI